MLTTDQLTRSLMREFLIRRNMSTTLKQFDAEFSERLPPVTRIEIIRGLCMERLVKLNKLRDEPRSTLLEMLVDYLVSKSSTALQSVRQTVPVVPSEVSPRNEQPVSRLNKMRKAPPPQEIYEVPAPLQVTNEQSITISRNKPREVESGNYLQVDTSKPKENQPIPTSKPEPRQEIMSDLDDLDSIFSFSQQPSQSKPISEPLPQQSKNNKPSEPLPQQRKPSEPQQGKRMMNLSKKPEAVEERKEESKIQMVEPPKQSLEQLPYEPIDLSRPCTIQTTETPLTSKSNGGLGDRKRRQQPTQIDADQLAIIKKAMFSQSGFTSLPKSWAQGFLFQPEKTFYGLLQREGGPCGVIAAVQAYYLKHLIILNRGTETVDLKIKQNCLVAALADILYKMARQGTQNIVIALASRSSNASEAIAIDACDQLVYPAKSLEATYEYLLDLKDLFIGETQGVTLLFYSVVLSKGIDNIMREMDNSDNTLIGNHGHCTQEMVNLMLTGKAVSNCFNGDKTLDENYVLHGIPERSEIGFLTIFEHFKYLEVGEYLKSPRYPIWVLCKEYHYSVIFGMSNSVITQLEQLSVFDVMFYDELYAPDDRIRLTIRRNGAQLGTAKKQMVMGGGLTLDLQGKDDDLTPTLELVLRTKWGSDIEVDWNDSMPIL